MGNTISPCYCDKNSSSLVKLILWEGTTRVLTGKRLAGEIMFEFPDCMVCHADSLYIGHPIPALAIDDELMTGQTYFVLRLNSFPCNVLTASALAALGANPNPNPNSKPVPVNFKGNPFEYIKGSNGRVLIKVSPEFIIKLITRGKEVEDESASTSPTHSFLCSTPELKKQYDMLVGPREQIWSPKLETISEYKIRYSPCRFIRFGMETERA